MSISLLFKSFCLKFLLLILRGSDMDQFCIKNGVLITASFTYTFTSSDEMKTHFKETHVFKKFELHTIIINRFIIYLNQLYLIIIKQFYGCHQCIFCIIVNCGQKLSNVVVLSAICWLFPFYFDLKNCKQGKKSILCILTK